MATFVNFSDVLRKVMPESKRGSKWLDWNNSLASPIRYINGLYYDKEVELDFFNSYSIQSKPMNQLLNDVYDPFHRGIFITQNNDPSNQVHFTVSIPDYLTYGNYEEIISSTLRKYLYDGIYYEFATYVSGVTHEASAYLTQLVSGLSGGDVLTDTEIWAVQNLYNKLKGSGLLSNFVKLHLISQSNKVNSLVDFINPSTGEMDEVGALTHTIYGLSSPGAGNYIETNFTPSTDISDPDNWCTVLHISKEGSFANEYILGSRNGSTASYVRMDKLSKELITAKGSTSNLINTPNSTSKGAYMFYIDSGEQNIIKNGSVIATNTAVSSAALSTNEEFLLDFNDSGSPFGSTSSDTVSTYAQIDSALDAIDRIYINKVLTEYNDRLKR